MLREVLSKMSEYPIQFTNGNWGMKHAMDDDWGVPDFDEMEGLEEITKEEFVKSSINEKEKGE